VSTPVKIYPVVGRFLHDTPARVQVIETKAEAEALIASGAFTSNPNDPERDKAAPDDTKPEAPENPGPPDSKTEE
jgi:hypothetical protein